MRAEGFQWSEVPHYDRDRIELTVHSIPDPGALLRDVALLSTGSPTVHIEAVNELIRLIHKHTVVTYADCEYMPGMRDLALEQIEETIQRAVGNKVLDRVVPDRKRRRI